MKGLSSRHLGVLMGLAAYMMWGVLPLYIRALRPVDPVVILAHRVIWSLLLLVAMAFAWKRWPAVLAALRSPRLVLALVASTLLIASNWLLYIYSINSGHAVQASLGYFINPLINVLLGVIFLRERMGIPEMIAVALAAAGVLIFAVAQGMFPLIPLGLALSFGLYGFVRKIVALGPVEGLLVETGMLAPFGLGWLLLTPALPAASGGPPLWMLMMGGLVTTVPMLLFVGAANRIRYSELGLLQYIGPTIQLLIAVRVFGEPLLPIHILTFGLIWTGLLVYVAATWHRGRVTPAMPE